MKKMILMLAMVLPMFASAQKIGHVSSQEIMAIMPETKKMAERLDSLQGVYETQLANMQALKLKKYEKIFFETESRLSPSSHSMPSLSDSVRQVVYGCKKRECIVATHSPANYHQSSINLR